LDTNQYQKRTGRVKHFSVTPELLRDSRAQSISSLLHLLLPWMLENKPKNLLQNLIETGTSKKVKEARFTLLSFPASF
jgi:hypothetical protein